MKYRFIFGRGAINRKSISYLGRSVVQTSARLLPQMDRRMDVVTPRMSLHVPHRALLPAADAVGVWNEDVLTESRVEARKPRRSAR
jgi:hypothetical protein